MIEIDGSVLLIIAIIVALVFILERLFFNPVLAAIELRNRHVQGPREEAARIMGEHDRQLNGLQVAINQARRRANEYKSQVRGEAQREGDGVVENAGQEARLHMQKQTQQLEEQKVAARALLAEQVQSLAQKITGYFVRG